MAELAPGARPGTDECDRLVRWLDYEHAHPDIRSLMRVVSDTGRYWRASIPAGPELAAALGKLVEALDWAKRAALAAAEPMAQAPPEPAP